METGSTPVKKSKNNLEKNRFIYFEIGLIFSLSIIFAAFEFPFPDDDAEYFSPVDNANFYVAQEVYMFKPLEQPSAKKKQVKKTVAKTTKTDPVKIDQPKTNIQPVVVTPVIVDVPKPDTTGDGKGKGESLPSNVVRIDKFPTFPGGEAALNDYIKSKLEPYPEFAQKNGFSGSIDVTFIISEAGKVINIKIAKGVRNSGLDDAITKMLADMPLWDPGRRNGKPAKFYITYPFRFELE